MYASRAERGVLAANAVREGGLLFTVPLRLALLDTPSPATACLPWAARLALRLLAERIYYPYMLSNPFAA